MNTSIPQSNKNISWYHVMKRSLDISVAILVLIITAPIFLIISLLIGINMGKPVIYKQNRVGKDEQIFKIWKFRTMTDSRDKNGNLLPDGDRLTQLGLFLRKTSLDEIPQLINVLKGEMSLVGPRPLLVRYVPRYSARQRLRHIVKPGITGLAQINGRNAIDWETRLELDATYAESATFWLDCKILWGTISVLIFQKDVVPTAGADIDEFWGTQSIPPNAPRSYPVEKDECF